jgi:hypothetical protein
MRKRFMSVVFVLALGLAGIASAASYSFNVDKNGTIAAHKISAGDYDVQVKGAEAVIVPSYGKRFTVPVKVETLDKVPDSNTIVEWDGNGNIKAITVGHAKIRLVFGQ